MKRAIGLILILCLLLSAIGCTSKSNNVSEFVATVLETNDTYVLVEPAEGSSELNSADRIEVLLKDAGMPATKLHVGSVIKISYDGEIQETYPARATRVYSIEIIQEASVPQKSELLQYTKEELSILLKGYSDADLVMAWGEPDAILSGMLGDVWYIDEAMVVIYYDDNMKIINVDLAMA